MFSVRRGRERDGDYLCRREKSLTQLAGPRRRSLMDGDKSCLWDLAVQYWRIVRREQWTRQRECRVVNYRNTRICSAFNLFRVYVTLAGVPKECDLSKNPLTSSIHSSSANSFGHLAQSVGSNNSGNSGGADSNGGRLHVSSGLCDPHNMHQDQVGELLFWWWWSSV